MSTTRKTKTKKAAKKTAAKKTAKAAAKTTARSTTKRATAKRATAKQATAITAGSTRKTTAARKKTSARKKVVKKRPTATKKRTVSKSAAKKTRPVAKKRTVSAGKRAAGKKTAATTRKRSVRGKKAAELGRTPRRAIYIDVENTSSMAALLAVIDSLKINRTIQVVELVAVGNWRAVGQQVARELAGLGAQLVHSAPARGVRDWSDLWIAVAAGGWIARADADDILEIVSNDKAFDAVGDAAAARGVVYQRVQHRRSASAPSPSETSAEAKPARRSRGGRRRRPRSKTSAASQVAVPAAVPTKPAHSKPVASKAASHKDDPHGASRDEMIDLVNQLTHGRSSPWVNLDILEGALKREGYSRPANSPRLVTRLRRLKDFEVDPHGRVRIVPESGKAEESK